MEVIAGQMQAQTVLLRLQDTLPFLKEINQLVEDYMSDEKQTPLKEILLSLDPYKHEIFRHTVIKELGKKNYLRGKYWDTIRDYTKAASVLIKANDEVELPSLNDSYAEMYNFPCGGNTTLAVFYMLSLISCYNNLAQCHLKLGKHLEAIDWLQEIAKAYFLREDLIRPSSFPWIFAHPTVLEFHTYYIKSQLRLAEVFIKLGNTGTAAHCSFLCDNYGQQLFVGVEEIERLRKQSKLPTLKLLRHPDFKASSEAVVINPRLQIRGSWKKIQAEKGFRYKNRAGFSSWIWKKNLYIFGGIDYSNRSKNLIDIWCLDLESMSSWRRLPDIPPHFDALVTCISDTKMCVWEDEAWLFFGSRMVLKFNLLQEQWIILETKWYSGDPWPYNKDIAVDYCAEIFEGKLHVFGGGDSFTSIGINLHMSLNLTTHVWTKLGGTTNPKELILGMPTFRRAAGSWVVPQEKRMYILYGMAVRPETTTRYLDHQYEDMWSYSFDENIWKHERFRGNYPAPRCRMACTYHPTFHQVLVFGGCNVRLPTQHSLGLSLITYFGDTFILDLKTRLWKQVLTRDFPHHRMCPQINVDVDTGKIYLYGGACSSDFLPSKKADEETYRTSLGDLWRLDLDLPGLDFDESEFRDKALVDSFGPWKLCFGCKEYKADMMKCGGTCGGRVYLCSADCQKNSWKEHKRLHQCGKR